MSNKLSEEFYDFLVEEDEPRACKAIPEEACESSPKNFLLNVSNGTLTKLAEKIISPDLTLTWVMQSLGASSGLIGMLVPIKDAGSLLPQLVVSGKIRSYSIRKYFWVAAASLQGLLWLLAAWLIDQQVEALPVFLLVLLGLFSAASGVGSISFKDVLAKTIDKKVRGQLLSYRSTFGGVLALLAGLLLVFYIRETEDQYLFSVLFFIAGLLWLAAALLFALINEQPGAEEGGRTPLQETQNGFHILKKDSNFRRFLLVRALLMSIPLVQPFFIVQAKSLGDSAWSFLGLLVITSGLAQVLSSPIWGKIADRSSPLLMRLSSGLSILSIALAGAFMLGFEGVSVYYFLPVLFINGVAYAGARLARKTYLVDYAPDEDRPTYVSVANTAIGLFTLVAAGFGFIDQWLGNSYLYIFFTATLLVAILLSLKLKKV